MNICILQHVPFEGAGTILPFFEHSSHRVQMIHLYAEQPLPSPKWPDLLIVMGGPMGVHDTDSCAWLAAEKVFIRDAIDAGAWALGVCLGAQLIADVLGASVTKNADPEIGWYPIRLNSQMQGHWLGEIFPEEFEALHWHGDTFAIPDGALSLGSSEACKNQGYIWGDRVIGLQFHLEFTPASTALLAEKCADELVDHPSVQTAEEMLVNRDPSFASANARMAEILEQIESRIENSVELHPQLEKDTHLLFESDELWVLLNRNAMIPWFILVPKGRFRDLDDLPKEVSENLFDLSGMLSNYLRQEFASEKINVAALGNLVPQLHLHVVGRDSRDICWPNPIWGNLNQHKDWTEQEISKISNHVNSILGES